MNRRDITKYLLAAGSGMVAGLSTGPALASFGTNRPPLKAEARARVYLGAEDGVALNYMMVLNGDRVLGLDLRKSVPQFADDGRRAAALYDDLSHPPLRRLLARADRVGTVYYFKRSLFVLPDAAQPIGQGHVAIVHRDRSYQPKPPMVRIQLKNRPADAVIREQPAVGDAWQAEDRLILLVHPTPLDGPVNARR